MKHAQLRTIGWLLIACTGAIAPSSVGVGLTAADLPDHSSWTSAGPHRVDVVRYEWEDVDRKRQVPVKIYFPAEGRGPFPLILFSHGLGGSREGYEYLGRHWAGCGFVSVYLEHEGSNGKVWQQAEDRMGSLRVAAADPRNAMDRPRDVSFAIDQLVRLNREDPVLKGRIDLERIGVAGHSFGAHTTLMVAGQAIVGPLGGAMTFADRRVKAAIPMSAPVPARRANLDRTYERVTIPCLHMTGTLDDSPIGETKAADRRLPFDHSKATNQFLVTFEGADHMVFSGRRPSVGAAAKDARFQRLILDSTSAFWDAYLKGDGKAKAWLSQGGFERELGKDGRFEKRLGDPGVVGSAPASRPE